MKLEKFLRLAKETGLHPDSVVEERQREGDMRSIYAHAEELQISRKLTPEIVELIVRAYDVQRSGEIISHFERYH